MKHTITIVLLLISGYSSFGQKSWEVVSKALDEKSAKNTIFWQYKDKLLLLSREKHEFSKESGLAEKILSTSEKSDKTPELRKEAMKWVTNEGVWLFGGISEENHVLLNDLWFYDAGKDAWQEIAVESKTVPSPRRGSGYWKDEKNNLWMFGGYQDESKREGSMNLSNDLWFFSTSERKWTQWESKNMPTPRANMAVWQVSPTEVLLYGGYGLNKEFTIARGLSDLWRFDSAKGTWTEPDGEKSPILRSFGAGGNPVHPGYRINPAFWTDAQGACWLTFGQSTVSLEKVSVESFLWKLDPKSLTWSFVIVPSGPYILSADHIMPEPDGSIVLYFPTYLNPEKELVHQSQILKLNPNSK